MICFETEKELALILAKVGVSNANELAKKIFIEKENINQLRQMAVQNLTPDQMRYLEEWQATTVAKKRKKRAKKADAIRIKYFGEIYNLRQKGYSFSQIAKYLSKFHHFRVDQSFLYRTFQDQLKRLEQAKKAKHDPNIR